MFEVDRLVTIDRDREVRVSWRQISKTTTPQYSTD